MKLTEPFEHYHFGGESTAADFSGVDMRGEVVLLTRNVRVVAEESNDWGCAILTSEIINFDQTIQFGELKLDNVEIYRGGQDDTYKSGIRFEGALRGTSLVENSVVWGGIAKPLYMKNAKNVTVKNTALIGGYQFGAMIRTVTNVQLDGLFVADIKRRFLNPNSLDIDKEAGIGFCSFDDGDQCFNSGV